jgi:hypothetical protein|eukprot:evm.model.NODE_7049_length_13115_cov_29.541822.1
MSDQERNIWELRQHVIIIRRLMLEQIDDINSRINELLQRRDVAGVRALGNLKQRIVQHIMDDTIGLESAIRTIGPEFDNWTSHNS